MVCDSLLKTGLLQVDCQNLACCKFFSTSCNKSANDLLPMTSCDKPYFYNHLLQFDGFGKFVCKLLTSFNKPVKLTIFNKFETFLAVNELITYWFTVKSGVLFPPILQLDFNIFLADFC